MYHYSLIAATSLPPGYCRNFKHGSVPRWYSTVDYRDCVCVAERNGDSRGLHGNRKAVASARQIRNAVFATA